MYSIEQVSGKNSPLIRKLGQQMMTDKLYNIYKQKIYINIILYYYHIINDEELMLIFDGGIDGEV